MYSSLYPTTLKEARGVGLPSDLARDDALCIRLMVSIKVRREFSPPSHRSDTIATKSHHAWRTNKRGAGVTGAPSSCATHSLLADRRQATLVEEALQALALHLGGVDVALAVDGDVVEVFELTRATPHAPEAADHLPVAAADHMDLAVGIVRGEPIGLPLIRPEHRRAGHARPRRVAQDRDFAHEGTVLLEYLDAVVAAVGNHHLPVGGDPDAVHRIVELLRQNLRIISDLLVCRLLAIGTPGTLERAGVGVEHGDAVIEVTIGHIEFVGRRIDHHVGGAADAHLIQAVGLLGRLADRHQEFAVVGELHHHAVVLAVAAEPDIAFVVDEHTVLVLRPVIALGGLRSAPRLDHIARLVELDHRGRGVAADRLVATLGALVAIIHRARTLADPDIVVLVHEDAADLPEDPIVRQRFRPAGIDLEFRRLLRDRSRAHECERSDARECKCPSKFHEFLLLVAPCFFSSAASLTYLSPFLCFVIPGRAMG